MASDLVSLRMLVISGARPERDLWRRGAGFASIPIEFMEADAAASAQVELARGKIDIVILDSTLPDAVSLIKSAHAASPGPFVVAAAPAGNLPAGRIEGADGVIAKPASVEEACKQIERCIRVKVPRRVLIVEDRKSTRLNSSHIQKSRMPSSA